MQPLIRIALMGVANAAPSIDLVEDAYVLCENGRIAAVGWLAAYHR